MEETEQAQRWEMTARGNRLHWPALGMVYLAVCGRTLAPTRTDDHVATYGSPLGHARCETCLRLCSQEALEMSNP